MLEIKPQGAEKYLPGAVVRGARKLSRRMLPKKYRLADRRMFRRALARGARVEGKFFVLSVLAGLGREELKAGVIISAKISKKAVVRNKIRRILYDSVRAVLGKIPKRAALVFLAKKSAAGAKKEEITEDVEQILERVNIQ